MSTMHGHNMYPTLECSLKSRYLTQELATGGSTRLVKVVCLWGKFVVPTVLVGSGEFRYCWLVVIFVGLEENCECVDVDTCTVRYAALMFEGRGGEVM